ncbi:MULTISPECIES: hypothetical protein [Methylobacterium]|uniref:hypothetical protein n=1 Tax=Methylobacterium TaxID=407 RepID=UPI00272E332B|nr:hypothetical protein [Methylobacterium sp.]
MDPWALTFCIALLDREDTPFDPVAHKRRDIGIKSVSVREEEGVDTHVCTIATSGIQPADIAGRRWAWLSFVLRDGTAAPIARMKRRPAAPAEAQGEVQLEFDVLPSDWMARRDVTLAPLKVLPWFDPILVSSERLNDPVEILDGHRRVVHFDRVTGACTTPELLGVGLPVKAVPKRSRVGWRNGGGVKIRRSKQPLAGVQVELSMAWQQADDGFIDMTPALKAAFGQGAIGDRTASGPSPSKLVPRNVVSTLTPDAFESSFPERGSGVGGASGYTILAARCVAMEPPPGAPTRTGALRGQKARYDFTRDTQLKDPIGLGFDVAYFDASLAVQYSLRQRREEYANFFIANRNVAYQDGAIEKLTLRCEDGTVDTSTAPYLPNQNVALGDVRRVGIYLWIARRAHVTRGSFSEDLYAADGTLQWEQLLTNGSPAGTANLATWFGSRRGEATCVAAAHKGIKKLSLTQRCIQASFTMLLEDWIEASTRWTVQLDGVDHPLIKDGRFFGKVIGVEIAKGGPTDFAKVIVTAEGCDGGGVAGPDQQHGVNPSGELWDGITLSSAIGQPYPATPVPGGVIVVENAPQEQVAYVQANDFTGEFPRNDKTKNDPKHLLAQVKTKLKQYYTPINGQPTLRVDYGLAASAWSGPAQVAYQEF